MGAAVTAMCLADRSWAVLLPGRKTIDHCRRALEREYRELAGPPERPCRQEVHL